MLIYAENVMKVELCYKGKKLFKKIENYAKIVINRWLKITLHKIQTKCAINVKNTKIVTKLR